MNTAHLDPLRQRVRALSVAQPPAPWQRLPIFGVGGLRSVGFDRESELLLVVSSSGRGVIDCQSGEKVARDDSEDYDGEEYLEARGIGPLRGKMLYGHLLGRPAFFTKIASESELRASGFSFSGRTLVVATSSDLTIYRRP